MIFQSLLFTSLGIMIGLFAGITPGIHVNTIIPIILSLSFFIKNPYHLAILIVSVAITEIFVDMIPSIFLGAPETDTALAVLPGHRLLLEGRGYEAIKLSVIGGIGGIIFSLVFILIFSYSFRFLYKMTRPYIHFLISFVVIFMIMSEKQVKKMVFAMAIIFLSGLLGLITLNSSLIPQRNTLFPVLTGLFGLSTLLISLSERSSIPKQTGDCSLKISKKEIIKSIILSSLAGIIVGFLPAVGISEAAVMMQYIGGSNTPRSFLVTVSGINASNDIFSLISLYLVGNPRSGTSVAIHKLLTELTFYDVLLLVGVICFTSGIVAMLTLFLGRKIPKFLARINYKKLVSSVIFLTILLVFTVTGIFGLLVLFTSTSIGVLCARLGIRRSHCMGCLLIPSILFFSGLNPFVFSLLRI